MANFHTHLGVGLATTGVLTAVCVVKGLCGFYESVILFGLGVVGSLLPDIDLPHSRPARLGFGLSSLFVGLLSSLIVYTKSQQFIDGVIAFGLFYLIMRYGVIAVFSSLTKHRGVVHSVPFMLMVALMVGLVFYRTGFDDKMSWLVVLFLFFGSLVHLLLDEIYSVNIFGLRLKKSFGSAFKFFETKKKPLYIIIYLAIGVLVVMMPSYKAVVVGMF